MILLGTLTGKILVFDSVSKKIVLRIGTASSNSKVVGIDFATESEDSFLYYLKSGGICKANIFDAFENDEFIIKEAILSTAAFDQNSQIIFAGQNNGKIHLISAKENLNAK